MMFPIDAFSHVPGRHARRGLLIRCRRPVFGWAQLIAAILMLIQPAFVARSVYVPDSSGNPYWLPLNGSDSEPTSGPDWSDDGSGNPEWREQYQAAVDAGQIVWWGGGTFLINGGWVNYPPQYHLAGYGDSDGDGIPDDLDPYP